MKTVECSKGIKLNAKCLLLNIDFVEKKTNSKIIIFYNNVF
jgi:hypothetical protein